LQKLAENIVPDQAMGEQTLRVIPYFCTASVGQSRRPDYETIIRAISQKLSLLPDFALAHSAEILHSRTAQGLPQSLTTDDWEMLLNDLLCEGSRSSSFVFVLDALDECTSPEETQRLLEFLEGVVRRHPSVQVLFSSRQHVPVKDYFDDAILYTMDVVSGAPKEEITSFISSEVEHRRDKVKDSIFCE
jgi:hypothetical protein